MCGGRNDCTPYGCPQLSVIYSNAYATDLHLLQSIINQASVRYPSFFSVKVVSTYQDFMISGSSQWAAVREHARVL